METYEVIVVGAGPGGLRCAEVLAKAGKRVLLLEKNSVIGPKVCAGGLTVRDLKCIGLPEHLTEHKFKEAILHTPYSSGSFSSVKYFGYTVNRKTLGQWQLKQLRKTKAVVRTNSAVTKVGRNYVVVNNSKKIRFKYLVGADGSLSIVRNYLGITSEKIGLAMQYLIKTKKYKQLEMFLDSDLFDAWYAWIFPHKHYVSIGFGCYPRWFPVKKMLDNFDKWLKEKKIDVSGERYEAHTINADFKGYKFGNIFLVGDAAGLTPGFTGKGIYPAFVSGEEVAKMIIDKNYVSKKMDRLIKIAKRQKNFVTLLHSIGPFRMIIYEFLTLLLRNKYLEKVILRHALE